jgi:hypothetical protein
MRHARARRPRCGRVSCVHALSGANQHNLAQFVRSLLIATHAVHFRPRTQEWCARVFDVFVDRFFFVTKAN